MMFDKTLEGVVWRRKSHFILVSLLHFGEMLKCCEIQKILLHSCKEGFGIKQQLDEVCRKFMYLPVYHPYRLSLTKTIKHLKNVATLTFDALNTLGCTAIRFWNQIFHTSVLYTTNCCHLQPVNLKASLTRSMLFCLQPQSTLTTERNWLGSMGHSVLQTKTHLDTMTSLLQYLFEDWFTIFNFDGSNLKVTYQINWDWTMLHKPFSPMRPVTHSVGFQIENMLKTC
jgi:hypothetical protein